MLSIFICEDEEVQLNKIRDIIYKAILMQDIDCEISLATIDPKELLKYIKNTEVNGLYFLDIDFKQSINGFTLANKIRSIDPRGFIVFITTHSEMSYMAFEYGVEALDYILKDIPNLMEQRIKQCINKAYERYCIKNNKNEQIIQIKYENKVIYVNLNDIVYIDSSVKIHKLELHTTNGIISFYGSLKSFESELDNNFIKCHKSFIVNINYIKSVNIKMKEISLTMHGAIPLSVKYTKNILEYFKK